MSLIAITSGTLGAQHQILTVGIVTEVGTRAIAVMVKLTNYSLAIMLFKF